MSAGDGNAWEMAARGWRVRALRAEERARLGEWALRAIAYAPFDVNDSAVSDLANAKGIAVDALARISSVSDEFAISSLARGGCGGVQDG